MAVCRGGGVANVAVVVAVVVMDVMVCWSAAAADAHHVEDKMIQEPDIVVIGGGCSDNELPIIPTLESSAVTTHVEPKFLLVVTSLRTPILRPSILLIKLLEKNTEARGAIVDFVCCIPFIN